MMWLGAIAYSMVWNEDCDLEHRPLADGGVTDRFGGRGLAAWIRGIFGASPVRIEDRALAILAAFEHIVVSDEHPLTAA